MRGLADLGTRGRDGKEHGELLGPVKIDDGRTVGGPISTAAILTEVEGADLALARLRPTTGPVQHGATAGGSIDVIKGVEIDGDGTAVDHSACDVHVYSFVCGDRASTGSTGCAQKVEKQGVLTPRSIERRISLKPSIFSLIHGAMARNRGDCCFKCNWCTQCPRANAPKGPTLTMKSSPICLKCFSLCAFYGISLYIVINPNNRKRRTKPPSFNEPLDRQLLQSLIGFYKGR